jgi:hypothetical protein
MEIARLVLRHACRADQRSTFRRSWTMALAVVITLVFAE